MSERANQFPIVVATATPPPQAQGAQFEGFVLGPWIARRNGAPGPGGSLISRRGNLTTPTWILVRRD